MKTQIHPTLRFAVVLICCCFLFFAGACSNNSGNSDTAGALNEEGTSLSPSEPASIASPDSGEAPPPTDAGASADSTDNPEPEIDLDELLSWATVEAVSGIGGTFSRPPEDEIYQSVNSAPSFDCNYPTIDSIAAISENVIAGTVLEVTYTDDDAISRTYYTVYVDEALKGSIPADSVICVCQSGGYVRLSTFIARYGADHFDELPSGRLEDTYLWYSFDGAPQPETGDVVILCLSSLMAEGRSDGCYELMREYIGKYILDPATGTYSRYIPEHISTMLQYRDANGNMITEAPLTLESARMLVQEAITAQ